jgi:hypothetical protein
MCRFKKILCQCVKCDNIWFEDKDDIDCVMWTYTDIKCPTCNHDHELYIDDDIVMLDVGYKERNMILSTDEVSAIKLIEDTAKDKLRKGNRKI